MALVLGIVVGRPLAAVALLPATLSRRLRPSRVLLLAYILGAVLPGDPPPSTLLATFPDRAGLVRAAGEVTAGPDLPSLGVSRLEVKIDEVGGRKITGKVNILLARDSPLPSPGARVEFTGPLFRPRPPGNPGELDARDLLARQGVTHFGAGSTAQSVIVTAPAPPLAPLGLLHRIRLAFERRIHSVADPETAAMLSCLLLGRRDRIPEEVDRDFRRSGTVHFLAISGLHVGILAGLLWFLFRLAAIPRRPAALAVAVTILVYAALTGMRPPVARASLLVLLAALGILLRRPVRPFHILAAAALVILVVDPNSLRNAGLLLSFSAVIAILLLARKFEEGLFARWILLEKFTVPRKSPLRYVRAYVRKSVPVSLAAWLGTGPILLHAFGTLSLLVLPANIIVLPLIAALLPAGLFAVLTGIDAPASLLSAALTRVVGLIADVPASSFALPAPSPLATALHFALLLVAAIRPRLGPRWAAGLTASLFLVALSGPLLRTAPAEPRLTVLSVGHGLSAVLETPEGGTLIYDAGSARPRIFDRSILPFLRHRRITIVDALVLSHADQDHVSGADALLDWMPVLRTCEPLTLRTGDAVLLPGATLTVVWPPPGFEGSTNDGSTVLRVQAGGLSALLTGDIEEETIRQLVASGADLRADVLVAPHHGRPEPGASELVRAVAPKIIVASAAEGEPLDPAYAGALRTGDRGAVTIRPNGSATTFR